MRLTHKAEYKDKRKNKEPMLKIRNKLFELENIEDELGVDLITLFKVLKSTKFYSKHPKTGRIIPVYIGVLYFMYSKWRIGCESSIYNEMDRECDSWDCDIKDYGKTWALTKEELL